MKRIGRAERLFARMRFRRPPAAAVLCAALLAALVHAQESEGEDSRSILKLDHYVRQTSTVPSIAGQTTQLYVRERVQAATLARARELDGRVVLFVHGAGTPAEVAFDVPYEDYSWMAYLAAAGYDVFSVDMTGYGRSTRPYVMNDPCNLAADAKAALGMAGKSGPCAASSTTATTTIASDWDDVDRAVDYIRELRDVGRVSLFGWSLGGPRAGGYAAQNPQKVDRLVLLAPAYTAESPDKPPAGLPAREAMSSQSGADFTANWDRQVGCENQYDPRASASVWSEMLKSDSVGATWGPGIRRAPSTAVWGWNADMVARMRAPTLMITGAHDAQVKPERVRNLYNDIGVPQKVLLDLGCASHNAMWERVHTQMFAASLEWLRSGTVDGKDRGIVRMGY